MAEFTVFIPVLPPTTNQAYRVGQGRFYMTAEGKSWKKGAQLAIQAANRQPEGFWRNKQLHVSLIFFDHSTITYDIDGRVKLALDAVADGLGFDDRYVLSMQIKKQSAIIPGVSVFVTDRIPTDPAAEGEISYICAACGRPAEAPLDLLDSGTTLWCDSCGGATIVDLETPRRRAERWQNNA